MKRKPGRYYCFLISVLFVMNSAAENIPINTSKDSLYLHDDFNIAGEILTNDNGSTGKGWSDNWNYQSGHTEGVALGDGYIYCTRGGFGITRGLVNPIKFTGSTFYVSFLFKKNSSGNFRISGHRNSDGVDRFGIHIKQDGKLGAQAGTTYANTALSTESFIENDKAYLVVAKYYFTSKPNMNISVYSVDDVIPTDEPANWDLEAEGAATGMEAIEYFRLAFTEATVNLDELKIGDTWKSVATTERDNVFPEIINAEIANSDVQKVDQELTSESKSWTYEVAQAGNYQIGYAWLWVHDTKKEVDIAIKVGDEIIKSFTAKSAIAPYRFETRLENLKQGETVTVTTTPKNGASYHLNYNLAFATPSFEGLAVFDVAGYGAVGDGTTNDYQAIQDALSAAKDAGGGIVTFNGSQTYYVEGPENYALFDFLNNSNISVEGNGAKIIMHPKGNFVRMDNSENIQVDGFTTTYNPLPYFQGEIKAMNVEELYLDMQVDDRYDTPLTGKYGQIQDIFGRSFWVTIPGTKMGEGRHLSVDSTAKIGNDDYAIRVFLQDHETADLQHSKNKNATHYIIPHKDFGHTTGYRDAPYCGIKRSSRVKISNILTHSVCHFGYTIGSNYGPITFTNTDMLVPHPEDMHVNWRDGWHVWGNRYGIMIEDGDFDGGYTYDDIFSPHVNVPIVESVSGNTVRLKSKPGESYHKYTDKPVWQIGDLVSFWDENQTVYYGMARITEVSKTERLSLLDIKLDNIIKEAQTGAYAINEETINRDMVIRNCTTTPKGRNVGVRQRTPILYQNCDFKNIHFWTYMGEPWRTRPRNVVFDNCIINERMTFNVDDTWNLKIKNCIINAGQIDVNNCTRLVMDSIDFTNNLGDAIKLRSASNAYVFGNYAYNGDPSALEVKYSKDISSTIHFTQPEVYPSYKPPFLVDQENEFVYAVEPFEIQDISLTNSGSGYGWSGNWTSSNAGVNINNSTSLIYPVGIQLNTKGGRILETQNYLSNERFFEAPVSLASGTFYLSFLAKKSDNGAFSIKTNNSTGTSRFGIDVLADGMVKAKSGTKQTNSNMGLFESDRTYFVLVKYTNTGGSSAVTRVKLYKNGDKLPADNTNIVWDVISLPASTGVDQDRLLITIESGTVELDEILVGNSFKSVTHNENYIPTNIRKGFSSIPDQLILHNKADGVRIIIPQLGGRLTLYDITGRKLYTGIITENSFFMANSILKKGSGVKLIQYQTKDKNYTGKIIR